METRKVIVKVAKKQPELKTVVKKKKEPRPVTKEEIIAWAEKGKKLKSSEKLFLEGREYYNFAQNIETMKKWFKMCERIGIKPNERLTILIEKDITE